MSERFEDVDENEVSTLLVLAGAAFASVLAVAFLDTILVFLNMRQGAPAYLIVFMILFIPLALFLWRRMRPG